jgi:hypothetical protein
MNKGRMDNACVPLLVSKRAGYLIVLQNGQHQTAYQFRSVSEDLVAENDDKVCVVAFMKETNNVRMMTS